MTPFDSPADPLEAVLLRHGDDDDRERQLGVGLVGLRAAVDRAHVGVLFTQPLEQLVVHGDLVGYVAEGPLGLLGETGTDGGIGENGELKARVRVVVHRLLEDPVHGRRRAGAGRTDADQRLALRFDLACDGDGLIGIAGRVVIGQLHVGHGAVAQLHATRVVDGLHRRLEHGFGVDSEGAQRPRFRPPARYLDGAIAGGGGRGCERDQSGGDHTGKRRGRKSLDGHVSSLLVACSSMLAAVGGRSWRGGSVPPSLLPGCMPVHTPGNAPSPASCREDGRGRGSGRSPMVPRAPSPSARVRPRLTCKAGSFPIGSRPAANRRGQGRPGPLRYPRPPHPSDPHFVPTGR